jgi:hypothetical protein
MSDLDLITRRHMRHSFTRFGKRAGHIACTVDPEYRQRPIANVAKIMGQVGGHKRRVHRAQGLNVTADHDLGGAFKDRDLFGAIVAMERCGAASRKHSRSRCKYGVLPTIRRVTTPSPRENGLMASYFTVVPSVMLTPLFIRFQPDGLRHFRSI